MDKFYKIKMQENFKDGNVQGGYPFKAGETYVVSEQDQAKIRQGGGTFEAVETMVKNPLKDLPEPDVQPADPRNPENEINEEGHVPGTEDEQEEIRARDEARKEKQRENARKAREAKAAKKNK